MNLKQFGRDLWQLTKNMRMDFLEDIIRYNYDTNRSLCDNVLGEDAGRGGKWGAERGLKWLRECIEEEHDGKGVSSIFSPEKVVINYYKRVYEALKTGEIFLVPPTEDDFIRACRACNPVTIH